MNLKVYRTGNGITEFWESWNEGTESFVRSGKIGEKGLIRRFLMKDPKQASEMMQEIEEIEKLGYIPRDTEQFDQIVIHYNLENWGSARDHERRVKIEDLMTECLAATGLGVCDGGDLGSGTMNVFCDVVDGNLAVSPIVDCFSENGELDGAIIARRERTGDDDYHVVWPKDFTGDFSF